MRTIFLVFLTLLGSQLRDVILHERSQPCSLGNVLRDTFESCCLHPSNSSELVREICTHTEDNGLQVETTVPGVWEYYNKALFTSMQDTGIGDGYDHNSFELISGSLVSGVFGFLWGAVAGAWSTIFSANQMAGQAYKMKLRQVKEFCRVKGLDFGTRAKLVA